MRFIEEVMAGRDVAGAHRIRLLGNDESCKDGDPAITSNVGIERNPGDELEIVVLRGVYISAGGTAEIGITCDALLALVACHSDCRESR